MQLDSSPMLAAGVVVVQCVILLWTYAQWMMHSVSDFCTVLFDRSDFII